MAANVKPLPVKPLPTWRDQLRRKKSGDPYGDEHNVQIALVQAPQLTDCLRYNEFHDRIELLRKLPNMKRNKDEDVFGDSPDPITWADEHLTMLQVWLQGEELPTLRKNVVQDAVIMVAKLESYNPVRDFLLDAHAAWDGLPRLDHWLKYYLDAQDNEEYLKAVGPKFLIGAVARVLDPGCKMDNILVFEGKQGKGKSTVVETLACGWSHDVTSDLAGKEAAIAIRGTWIAELGELAGMKRSDQESVKGFLSRRVDHYRPPYGRNAIDAPRQTVFIATTNETDYLQDPTGARRFWPVACGKLDVAALRVDVHQLWGEAVQRYKDGEPWHLDEAQTKRAVIEQRARQKTTILDEAVLEYADRKLSEGVRQIAMRELLQELFDCDPTVDPAKAGGLASQIARALTREGWLKLKPTGRGKTRKQLYEWPEDAEMPETSQGS